MADSTKIIVFISRSSIDVDSCTRKGPWKSFRGDADAIGKGCDVVEFSRFTRWWW